MNAATNIALRLLPMVVGLVFTCTPGCRDATEPSPAPARAMPLSGRWVGDIDSLCAFEQSSPGLLFELTQRDSVITGYIIYNCLACYRHWTVIRGSVVGGRLLFEAISPDTTSAIAFSALIDSVAMHGTCLHYYPRNPEWSYATTWSVHKDPKGKIHCP